MIKNLRHLESQLFSSDDDSSSQRKQAIGGIVHLLVSSVEIVKQEKFDNPLLDLNAKLSNECLKFITLLKNVVFRHVIQSNSVQLSTYRGHHIVRILFKIFLQEGASILPDPFRRKFIASSSEKEAARIVGDYIAGMTDSFARKTYESLNRVKVQSLIEIKFIEGGATMLCCPSMLLLQIVRTFTAQGPFRPSPLQIRQSPLL